MKLDNQLQINRCPNCNVDRPSLVERWSTNTNSFSGNHQRYWKVYCCSRCGGLVTAGAPHPNQDINEIYPSVADLDAAIPETAKHYLEQAINSLHAPAGAVMLAASAVDSMLKAKGYKTGKLYTRINAASKAHTITEDMAKWAHEVRLDANDQRHTDEKTTIPTPEEAKKTLEFAKVLAEFMFVLPSKITRGLKEATESLEPKTPP